MAKKKTKIVSNRGFATVSTPSKQLETPKSQPKAKQNVPVEKVQETVIQPEQTVIDPILKLVEKYNFLNEHKAQATLDRLMKQDTTLSEEYVKKFRLSADVENDLLKIIKIKQNDLFGSVELPVIKNEQDKEKLIGQYDILYRTLLKIGFNDLDITTCFQTIKSTLIEDHLDWLCVNVPYERMPIGLFDKYYTESDDEDQLIFIKNENKNTSLEQVKEDLKQEELVIEEKQENKVETDVGDMKSRILQAAQQYMDEEDEDINEKYAKLKIDLSELEKYVPSNASQTSKKNKKSKQKFTEDEKPAIVLSDDELAKVKKDIKKLKDRLASLEADWDFDKKKAEQIYIQSLQKTAEEKRKKQLDAIKELKNKKAKEDIIEEINDNDNNDDDDDGGMFSGMMMDEEEELTAMSQHQTYSSIQWNIIKLDVPKSHVGLSAKDLLLKHCNKQKLGKQSYNSTNVGSGIWRSTLKIVKNAANNEYLDFKLSPDVGTNNRQDSEQLIALYGLFQLDHESSVYKVLPTSYKDVWSAWLDEKKSKEEEPRLESDKIRLSFLANLVENTMSELKAKSNLNDTKNVNSTINDTSVTRSNQKTASLHELFKKMQQKFKERLDKEEYLRMKGKRLNLPISAYREEIIELLNKNQVLIISGETGCGKSTQVPQFLAEDLLINSKEGGHVICTQPRRISAMSIANRVSIEMGDRPKSTGSRDSMVGYQIRLESKSSAENVLLFCTTGILLRRLESDEYLDGVSHVIVDEVHERTIESDFLLVILKKLCHVRTDLKIILMSATVEASRFSNYFGNCPVISVPGRTYPVHVQYLEDVIEKTGYTLEEDSPYAIRRTRVKKDYGDIHVSGQSGSTQRVHYEIFEEDTDDEDPYDPTNIYSKVAVSSNSDTEDQKDQEKRYSKHTRKMIKRMDDKKINYDLILELLEQICSVKKSQSGEAITNAVDASGAMIPETGAILIFLPGMNEIRKLFDTVSSHHVLGNPKKFLLIALHSTLSSEHQEKAFEVPPEGVRKIVFSTNIAETGVTISDVTVVIDTGMARVISYDEKRRVTRLLQKYVAKANARQRRGRAGRVQEGICFHLFTQEKFDEMPDFEIPEILRLPLEELCLRIKVCGLGNIRSVLSNSLDPPTEKMIDNAILTLQEVQALSTDGNETLTPLGAHLSNLPVDVHIGKMILFGAIFRCLDPILTIAASLSYKSPFIRPFGKEDEADAARARFKVYNSDFLTIYNAYEAWRSYLNELQSNEPTSSSVFRKIRAFCKQNFLSEQNLEMIEDMKRQYLGLLISIGFVKIDGSYRDNMYDVKRSKVQLCNIPDVYNTCSQSIPVINAALTAGLYPKIAEYLTQSKQFINKDMELQVHPSSVLFQKERTIFTDFLVYNTVVMTNSNGQFKDRVFMWEAAWIDTVAVILLSTDVDIKHKQRKLQLDSWIHIDCFARTGVLLKFLRKELNNWLAEKMKKPDLDISKYNEDVMNALIKTLEANTF